MLFRSPALVEIDGGIDAIADAQVLVGFNDTRWRVIEAVRRDQGREPGMPSEGDQVICLQNNRDLGVFNGQTWVLQNNSAFTITFNATDAGVALTVSYRYNLTAIEAQQQGQEEIVRTGLAFKRHRQQVQECGCHQRAGRQTQHVLREARQHTKTQQSRQPHAANARGQRGQNDCY